MNSSEATGGASPGEYSSNVVALSSAMGRKPPPGPPLQPPGGGGTFDGMEARVARLEADVGHIKDDVGDLKAWSASIRTDISSLKTETAVLSERVSHLPGKGFIVTVVGAAATVLIGVLTGLAKLGILMPPPP